MKKHLFLLAILFSQASAFACDACKKQQPQFLQEVSHGPGAESKWDYLIVAVMVIITVYVLVATIRCVVRPRETSDAHIKRMILKELTR